MENETYVVKLALDANAPVPWPKDVPAPAVGDKITGLIHGLAVKGTVVEREWGVDFAPGKAVIATALTITVKSQALARPKSATVQPLKL
ncbi:hypothetical protein O0880_14545 [Janthinobacterium sp. SUN118]|uniref:hypothetical protein n=1 Tax=Janthinobacterium sp. SUN118 TaxID=3004100 RepID=UPI0025AF4D67|nr:hypothetical protein [Janthinobacterium sp. SUN118]MDN2710641.1 hypothetical protein [Janthinobacterium sp. SUN118]